MLLAVDVGNTHTVFGSYVGETLQRHWRVRTNLGRTTDEYGVILESLFAAEKGVEGVSSTRPTGVVISSVVPPVTQTLAELSKRYLDLTALVIGPGVPTGMPILYDDPRQAGSDRVVNAVAAFARTGTATIVVDCGTATKFDFISAGGEYHGGAIAPGLGIAEDALFERTTRLFRVELTAPRQVVGRNTTNAIQAGLIYGYVAMIDGMVTRIRKETGTHAKTIATGGFAGLLTPYCNTIDLVDPLLTLEGMRLIYERNVEVS